MNPLSYDGSNCQTDGEPFAALDCWISLAPKPMSMPMSKTLIAANNAIYNKLASIRGKIFQKLVD